MSRPVRGGFISALQSPTTRVGIAISYAALGSAFYLLTPGIGFVDEENAMEEVTLARATAAIQASLVHARQKSLAPLTVVVLDAGGHVRASAREDGAGFSGIDIASAKARGALSFSMSSRQVAEIFGGNAALCATLAATMNGQMLPIPGAVLINNPAGRVIGAIAAAGDAPDNDEAAALAGLSALRS